MGMKANIHKETIALHGQVRRTRPHAGGGNAKEWLHGFQANMIRDENKPTKKRGDVFFFFLDGVKRNSKRIKKKIRCHLLFAFFSCAYAWW